jgi:hypothetical protein
MDLTEIVMRLTGPVDPVGDSHVDRKRLANLESLCQLTGELLDRIEAVAETSGDHMASVKAAKGAAAAFLLRASGVAFPAVHDAVWEALQRLIENAASLGPSSQEDAMVVARWRGQFVTARERTAAVSLPQEKT